MPLKIAPAMSAGKPSGNNFSISAITYSVASNTSPINSRAAEVVRIPKSEFGLLDRAVLSNL
jgi:hypothetical protein